MENELGRVVDCASRRVWTARPDGHGQQGKKRLRALAGADFRAADRITSSEAPLRTASRQKELFWSIVLRSERAIGPVWGSGKGRAGLRGGSDVSYEMRLTSRCSGPAGGNELFAMDVCRQ
jgi:hypothetical protein